MDYQLLILTGPSGVGKSSLAGMLLDEGLVTKCVTCTTRKPRKGEVEGKDYHFLSQEDFLSQKEQGEFVESNFHYENWYGVRIKDIEKARESSHALVTLNWEGASMMEKNVGNAHVIFIAPPSMEVLAKRLEKRGCKSRFEYAEEDLEKANMFEYCIINDDLEKAYESLEAMVLKIIGKKGE